MFLFSFVVTQLALDWRKETAVFTGAGSRCVGMHFGVSYAACPFLMAFSASLGRAKGEVWFHTRTYSP